MPFFQPAEDRRCAEAFKQTLLVTRLSTCWIINQQSNKRGIELLWNTNRSSVGLIFVRFIHVKFVFKFLCARNVLGEIKCKPHRRNQCFSIVAMCVLSTRWREHTISCSVDFSFEALTCKCREAAMVETGLLPVGEATVCRHACVANAGSGSHRAPPSELHFRTASFFLCRLHAQPSDFQTAFPFQSSRQVLIQNLDIILAPMLFSLCVLLSVKFTVKLHLLRHSKAHSRLFTVICRASGFASTVDSQARKKAVLVNVRWQREAL